MAVEEYYYLIFPSNNGKLIETALAKRPYWKVLLIICYILEYMC